jgi:tetratricopeptide (TPR) repeat protein
MGMTKWTSATVLIIVLLAMCQLPAGPQTYPPEELKKFNSQREKLYLQGKYREAITIAEKILSIIKQEKGLVHPETAAAENKLGLLYLRTGCYAIAEPLLKHSLEIREAKLGKDDPAVAESLDNLATLYVETHRYAEAEPLYERSLGIRQTKLGWDDRKVAESLNNLATLYVETHRYAEAESLYKQSLFISETRMGIAVDPNVAITLKKLEELYNKSSAFWNTWFENQANGKRSEVLETGNVYDCVLDLSRFAYFTDSSAAVSPSIQEKIDKALKRGETKAWFKIRPILHGDFLRFDDNQAPCLKFEVDLNKLRKPSGPAGKEMEIKHKKFRSDGVQLRELTSLVQAGAVKFAVVAQNSGKAVISLSIWDRTGMIPLDHLKLQVQVIKSGAEGTSQDPASQTHLKSGLGTLLDVSDDFAKTGDLIADAAFYIFEEPRPSLRKSIVLFAAKTDPAEKNHISINAWETETLLSDYVGDKGELLSKIREARKKADKGEERCYQDAAEELALVIFSGKTTQDKAQAHEAKQILSDLVKHKKGSPIVFVRMINDGVLTYLPLGILAAQGKHRILEERIILVQPLPRERYPGSAHPVPLEAWTFGVPQELEGVKEKSPGDEALKKLTISDLPLLRDIREVREFLKTGPAPGTKPEGFLLLAHQGGGNLWFTDFVNRIKREHINRGFPSGSVAILSACSVAAPKGNNQAILEKLNWNGIDAMIISPFPVYAEYGIQLAIHFVEALREAKINSKSLTTAELFAEAREKTSEHFKNIKGRNYEDMDLEFIIAGDYRISTAPAKKKDSGEGGSEK